MRGSRWDFFSQDSGISDCGYYDSSYDMGNGWDLVFDCYGGYDGGSGYGVVLDWE